MIYWIYPTSLVSSCANVHQCAILRISLTNNKRVLNNNRDLVIALHMIIQGRSFNSWRFLYLRAFNKDIFNALWNKDIFNGFTEFKFCIILGGRKAAKGNILTWTRMKRVDLTPPVTLLKKSLLRFRKFLYTNILEENINSFSLNKHYPCEILKMLYCTIQPFFLCLYAK